MTLRQISEMVGTPIVELDTGDILGQVENWTVTLGDQKVLSFVLRKEGWLGKRKAVLCMDILEYGPEMIVVRDSDSIINPHDVVGLSEAIDRNQKCIGMKAVDENEGHLGRIRDFVFDITDSCIQRYYIAPGPIRGMLYNDLVLTRSQVIRLNKDAIVFQTDGATPVVAGGVRETEPKSV